MSLAVKTLVAPNQAKLAVLVQTAVARGWRPIDPPAPVLHDGQPRNGEQWAVHLQRRA